MCSDGFICVHGRLANSSLSAKISNHFTSQPQSVHTYLFIRTHLTPGPKHFWQVCIWHSGRCRSLARSTLHKYLTCFKFHSKFLNQIMAPLPKKRTIIQHPFNCTGVDFCGPINVRSGIRRVIPVNAYLSVFFCFSKQAILLELVHGLATDTFLAALKWFIACRGHCSDISFRRNHHTSVVCGSRLSSLPKLNWVKSQMAPFWHLKSSVSFCFR